MSWAVYLAEAYFTFITWSNIQILTGYPLSLPNGNSWRSGGGGGGGDTVIYIPIIFHLWEVILVTFGLSHILLNNICISWLFKITKGASSPLRWKRNWNQNRKNWEAHWIPNLKNLILFLTKTKEQMLKNRKATNHNNHQKQKTKVFWPKTKTKTYLKIT